MLRLRWRSLFRKSSVDTELDAELEFHLDKQIEENIAAGMSPKEARTMAVRQFGDLQQRTEECRDERRIHGIEDLLRDLGYAARMLRKSPGFTMVAVLSLALGIGANTAIFSLINPMLLRPLNVPQPERLVRVLQGTRGGGEPPQDVSYPNYVEIRKSARGLESLAASSWPVQVGLGASAGARSERVFASMVSGNYFSTLGVHAALGRTFLPGEDKTRGDHPVVVVSHDLWKRRFGSDPNLPGKTILLGGRPFDVIGVMPADMPRTDLLFAADLWIPLAMQAEVMNYKKLDTPDTWLSLIGRLSPGATRPQAQAELSSLAASLEKDHPKENRGLLLAVVPEPAGRSRIPELPQFAWIFLGVTGFVLLLACANLAGLQLARSAARGKEIGIRFAIGASRRRVFRQLLTESLLVSLLGGLAGLGAGVLATRLILTTLPPIAIPFAFDTRLDWRVLLFTLGVSILSGLLFGTFPAIRSLNNSPILGIKRNSSGQRTFSQGVLVAGQLAITCLLLISATLLLHSLRNAQHLALGFDPQNRIIATVNPDMQGYSQERTKTFQENLMRRAASIPDVISVSSSIMVPLSGGYLGDTNAYIEGETPIPDYRRPVVYYDKVGTHYFETMGTPILRGRDFSGRDTQSATQLAVVNEAFAKAFWPGQNPIGKRFRLWKPSEPLIEIVGVVPEGKYNSLGEDPQRHVFIASSEGNTLVLHTAGDPAAVEKMLPAVVAEIDPRVPVTDVMTMDRHLGFTYYPARVAASMMSILGGLAILVAAIGIYGIFAFHVRQRTKEFGIRMAIGARPASLMSLIFRQAAVLIGAGLTAGLIGAFLLVRLLANMLYGLNATDPVAFLSGAILLSLVAFAAISVPAMRAARVDPLTALREE